MGQLFGNLTHSAVVSPDGTLKWQASPAQAGKTLAAEQSTELQPSSMDEQGNVQPNQSAFSRIIRPTLAQAATGPAGTPNALSPGLSKAGKLVTLLTSGLQGALAGRAAQEQTIAQTGGHRAGGIGTGFQAAYQLPWQRAQQQAEAQLTQAGLQPVTTPYGQMPAGFAAKIIAPYLGYQGKVESARIGAAGREQEAQTKAGAQVQAAEIGKRFIPVSGVGLFDTSSRQIIPGTQQGIVVTPEIADDYQLPKDFIGKPMTLANLASVQRSSVFENVPQMTAQGPIIVNRRNAQATPVAGPGGTRYSPPALASPREIADINNPGETLVVPAGQSFGQPGAQSASVQVPRQAAKAQIPTNVGNLKVAFNTALQHAGLLESAAKALQNGDQQTLNSLKNRFKNEFGSTEPITAQTVADAYGREITKMLSAGHMTDNEISTVGKTINPNRQSLQQVMSVLGAYRALAQSKLNMLNQQVGAATGAVSRKPNGNTSTGDPLGIR